MRKMMDIGQNSYSHKYRQQVFDRFMQNQRNKGMSRADPEPKQFQFDKKKQARWLIFWRQI
jgi:hypothetical protein